MTFFEKPDVLHTQLNFNDIICLGSVVTDHENDITLAEKQAVERGVVKRRHEYATGRWLARYALAAIGVNHFDLLPGQAGQPVWPKNIVGSITHADNYAAAVVTSRLNYHALGIDVERMGRLECNLLPKVLLPDERQRFIGIDATLIFSIKESCYKLLYPLVGDFIDFLDIKVHLDDVRQTFNVCYVGRHKANAVIEQAEGQYLMFNGHWLTCMMLKANKASAAEKNK